LADKAKQLADKEKELADKGKELEDVRKEPTSKPASSHQPAADQLDFYLTARAVTARL